MLAIAIFNGLQVNEVRQRRFVQHVLFNTPVDTVDASNIADYRCVGDICFDFRTLGQQQVILQCGRVVTRTAPGNNEDAAS